MDDALPQGEVPVHGHNWDFGALQVASPASATLLINDCY
jgi:hypothetical protein